ncbi:MAG TPA: histidine kinase [Gemmatimonadaceae bacterium]|nr:histidine kinase [Gemmatimonadaceae bacterium]
MTTFTPPVPTTDVTLPAAPRLAVGAWTGALRRGLLYFGLWTLVALFTTQQQAFTLSYRNVPFEWRHILVLGLSSCWLWAAFTPPMVWLARRYRVERETWVAYVPLHVLFALGFALADVLAGRAMSPWIDTPGTTSPPIPVAFVRGLFLNVTCYLVVVAITEAVDYAALYRDRELQASELRAQLAAARLGALQSQLRPHFLFNTLNTIAEQVYTDPAGADRMLTRLGALLRASFGGPERQEVPLREELALLRSYLDIMRVRFRDRVVFDIDADPDALDVMVPALVLQPLVENAIRHGIEPMERGGRIEVVARRRLDRLELEVRDDGCGLRDAASVDTPPSGVVPARPGSGVGLRNTRDRLRQLYGPAHHFAVRERAGGGVIVAMSVPVRSA